MASAVDQMMRGDCSCPCVNHSCCLAEADDSASEQSPVAPTTSTSFSSSKLLAAFVAPVWRNVDASAESVPSFVPIAEHQSATSGTALCRMNCTFLI